MKPPIETKTALSRSSRRSLLKLAAAHFSGAPAIMARRSRRPNVLFILADEWRAQATGYNGDVNVRTPVLNRLAAEA